jgi:hypothetical protein
VSQSPQVGKRVPGGSKVRLNISSGQTSGGVPPPPPPPPPPPGTKPATVTVPDVTGRAQEAAQRQLNSAGLKAGVVYVPSDQPEGTVVSQSPEAGTTQKRGTRIQLNVSLGSNPGNLQPVPDVLGYSYRDDFNAAVETARHNIPVVKKGILLEPDIDKRGFEPVLEIFYFTLEDAANQTFVVRSFALVSWLERTKNEERRLSNEERSRRTIGEAPRTFSEDPRTISEVSRTDDR